MAFDKQWAVEHEEYWNLLGQIMRKHITNTESAFVYLGETLEKLKKDFDNKKDTYSLRYDYLFNGFPQV